MRRSRVILPLVLSALLAACSAGAPSPSSSVAPPASPADPSAPASGDIPKPSGDLSVKIASPSGAGFSHLPLYITADRLNGEGWNVEFVNFAGNDLAFQALISGEAQISHGATGNAMLAIQKGAAIQLVSDRNKPEWVLVSNDKISRCEDLSAETRVARSSAGDSILPQMQPYFDTCGAQPTVLIIADSGSRIAALESGELDAAPVELSDWVKLNETQPGKFRALAFLADNLPNLSASGIYANSGWVDANREVAVAFFAELLQTTRAIYEDPSIVEAAAAKFLESNDESIVGKQIEEYTAKEMWPVNGAITDETMQFTIDFNVNRGYLEAGLTPADVWDPSVLADAVALVGAVPGKP